MNFSTFRASLQAIADWREAYKRPENDWPDSRDPDLVGIFNANGVVSQDVEKAMIALAAYRHAEFTYQSMSAVAKVIVNRQKNGDYRTHLTDEDQFPLMTIKSLQKYADYPVEEDSNFKSLLENLDDILTSRVYDMTQGALWFGEVNEKMPEYFREIVRIKEMTIQMGRLSFFK